MAKSIEDMATRYLVTIEKAAGGMLWGTLKTKNDLYVTDARTEYQVLQILSVLVFKDYPKLKELTLSVVHYKTFKNV